MIWRRCLVACIQTTLAFTASVQKTKQPNLVFILTDDQDYEMQSLDYMPLLQRFLIDEGTSFINHYCTVAICCPSRVNIWTGKAAHNTNVTDLSPPYGGYPKFVAEGFNEDWLPVWLQDLGYSTYYTGKLFNSHDINNYNAPEVNGFNGSDFLLDPFTYEYFNGHMTRNGAAPISYQGQYSPDVIAQKAYEFLDEAALHQDRPFFLGIAPIAPHSNMRVGVPFIRDTPFYADRHAHLFQDYKIPRTPNLNPDSPSGAGWVKKLPKLNATIMDYHDEFARARLRSLQSVDEMVEEVVKRLQAKGLLENTYIFYSSDNGYHVGQHRLPPGKECAFEEDIHVPLIVRGPGVPKGHIAHGIVSSHTDLSPTLLKLAGSVREDLDGAALPLTMEELSAFGTSGEHVNVEFWGGAIPEGKYGVIGNWTWNGVGDVAAKNNTYKSLRLISKEYSLSYIVHCDGEKEFYDLKRDPYQIHNLLSEDHASLAMTLRIANRHFRHILNRVDALLLVLKSCKADTCRSPWNTLHPDGNVKTLTDALAEEFDGFYGQQSKVGFSSCQMGYIRSEEGPQHAHVWKGEETRMSGLTGDGQQVMRDVYLGHWSWWT